MEIILRGKVPDEKPVTAKCSHCDTIVRFYRHEAKVMPDHNETYLLIDCPVCHKGITYYGR